MCSKSVSGVIRIIFSFAGQVGEKVTIKVFITLGDGAFKLPRFSPKINNLQYTWFFGQEDTAVLETLG